MMNGVGCRSPIFTCKGIYGETKQKHVINHVCSFHEQLLENREIENQYFRGWLVDGTQNMEQIYDAIHLSMNLHSQPRPLAVHA